MPSSLTTLNVTHLVSNNTHTVTQTIPIQLQRLMHGSVVDNERANRGMTMNKLHVVLHNPRRPTDGLKWGERGKGRQREGMATIA